MILSACTDYCWDLQAPLCRSMLVKAIAQRSSWSPFVVFLCVLDFLRYMEVKYAATVSIPIMSQKVLQGNISFLTVREKSGWKVDWLNTCNVSHHLAITSHSAPDSWSLLRGSHSSPGHQFIVQIWINSTYQHLLTWVLNYKVIFTDMYHLSIKSIPAHYINIRHHHSSVLKALSSSVIWDLFTSSIVLPNQHKQK